MSCSHVKSCVNPASYWLFTLVQPIRSHGLTQPLTMTTTDKFPSLALDRLLRLDGDDQLAGRELHRHGEAFAHRLLGVGLVLGPALVHLGVVAPVRFQPDLGAHVRLALALRRKLLSSSVLSSV